MKKGLMLAASLCLFAGASMATETHFSFDGVDGDWISSGQDVYMTPDNSDFTWSLSEDGNYFRLDAINYDTNNWWYLHLTAPAGLPLQPGFYDNATRWPFSAPEDPSLS